MLNSNYASLPLRIYIMVWFSTSFVMWYIPKIVVLCTKLLNMHIASLILWKEFEYQIWSSQACKGFLLLLPCRWCYEWYHITFLCWICIECLSSEPLWKMYLYVNKHFLNLNLKSSVRDACSVHDAKITCQIFLHKMYTFHMNLILNAKEKLNTATYRPWCLIS